MKIKLYIIYSILFCLNNSIVAQSQIESKTNFNLPEKVNIELAKIDIENLSEYIPYYSKKKWGWIYKKNQIIATKAIFEEVDFNNQTGLPFKYKGEYYILNKSGEIKTSSKETKNRDIYNVEREIIKSKIISDSILNGFTFNEYNDITEHSDRFKKIKYLSKYKIGIAENKNGTYSVINSKGDLADGFPFYFSSLKSFYVSASKTRIIGEKINENKFKIYNPKGEVIYDKEFKDYKQFIRMKKMNYNDVINNASFKYLIIKNKKYQILDLFNLELISQESYNQIKWINAPTDRKSKISGFLYFFVSKRGNKFYLDKKGIEYYKK